MAFLRRKEKTLASKAKQLAEQLAYLKQEKDLLEEETKVKALMSQIHPSKKEKAFKAIRGVLGEVRGTPQQRKARRESIQKGIKSAFAEIKAFKEKEEGRAIPATFILPKRYYANILGKGWEGEKEGKPKKHYKKVKVKHKRRMYSRIPYRYQEPYYMPYQQIQRRRIVY